MIKEQGVVTSLNGNFAVISVNRRGTCQLCPAKSLCGTAAIAKFISSERRTITLPNTINAVIGDPVLVSINETDLLKSAALIYLLPLLLMLLGAALIHSGFNSEFASVLGGALGLLLGFVVVSSCLQKKAIPRLYAMGKRIAVTPISTSP